jgi:putative transposase
MANTYSQIYIHCVFAVKGRKNFLHKSFRAELFQYMSGILSNLDVYPLAVNGWVDHVHLFFNMPVDRKIPEIMRIVKANSSKWINSRKLVDAKFAWQNGYGAFSYSKSHIDNVIKYIMNQEQHHQKKTFEAELLKMYDEFAVEYDKKYLFDFYERE